METHRQNLLTIYAAGVEAVRGDNAVYNALMQQGDLPACHIISIGKAAEAMYQGAKRYLGDTIYSALLISKFGHYSAEALADPQLITLESAHPVPSESSLSAGQTLLAQLAKMPTNEPCLFLISGGASSLCEVLTADWDLDRLQALTQTLLGDAYDIHAINAVRQRLSCIKGGKLWQYIGQRPVQALLISDVAGDDPTSIGSGLLFPPAQDSVPQRLPAQWQAQLPPFTTPVVPADFKWQVVASNDLALQAMRKQAEALSYPVTVSTRFLSGDAGDEARRCLDELCAGETGLQLWGGETTVKLPENPGRGGRNQHFALSAALARRGEPAWLLLAAGTDGSDGLSEDTGALVDGASCERGAQLGVDAADCLRQADSGRLLAASGDLIHTGPTGTNVMDVVIGLKVA